MSGQAKRTVLLVEDDLTYAHLIEAAIASAQLPYEVRHVTNLHQALAYVRAEQPYADRDAHPMPSIILLDLNLAERSGFPVLIWLRQNGQLENTRVIILTASDHTEDVQQALQLGASSYLLKSPSASNVTNLLATVGPG